MYHYKISTSVYKTTKITFKEYVYSKVEYIYQFSSKILA